MAILCLEISMLGAATEAIYIHRLSMDINDMFICFAFLKEKRLVLFGQLFVKP